MPDTIAKLRDKAVVSTDESRLSWEESTQLFEWLTYESDWLDYNHITCFIPLSRFILSDSDLRERLELSESDEINDDIRLAYARHAIEDFDESGGSVFGSTVVKLEDGQGRETYACWLSETMGQAGEIADWYGCFPSEEAFFSYLKAQGWWNLSEDVKNLTWDRLKVASNQS